MKALNQSLINTITVIFFLFLLTGCPPPVDPNPVVLSLDTVSMEAGKTTEVMVTQGANPFNVSSSAPSVATATINGNKLTISGISQGKATITVSDINKSSASITVTVSDWKADASLRFEPADRGAVKNADCSYLFYSD